eukprot:8604994-Alexandrium_andersonii.AAC.1
MPRRPCPEANRADFVGAARAPPCAVGHPLRGVALCAPQGCSPADGRQRGQYQRRTRGRAPPQ